MLVAVVVLVVLLAAAAAAVLRPEPRALALLGVCCLLWWLVNGPLEGPVLWRVTTGHGLTVADLLVPVVGVPALLAVLRRRSARPDPARGRAQVGHRGPRG